MLDLKELALTKGTVASVSDGYLIQLLGKNERGSIYLDDVGSVCEMIKDLSDDVTTEFHKDLGFCLKITDQKMLTHLLIGLSE